MADYYNNAFTLAITWGSSDSRELLKKRWAKAGPLMKAAIVLLIACSFFVQPFVAAYYTLKKSEYEKAIENRKDIETRIATSLIQVGDIIGGIKLIPESYYRVIPESYYRVDSLEIKYCKCIHRRPSPQKDSTNYYTDYEVIIQHRIFREELRIISLYRDDDYALKGFLHGMYNPDEFKVSFREWKKYCSKLIPDLKEAIDSLTDTRKAQELVAKQLCREKGLSEEDTKFWTTKRLEFQERLDKDKNTNHGLENKFKEGAIYFDSKKKPYIYCGR